MLAHRVARQAVEVHLQDRADEQEGGAEAPHDAQGHRADLHGGGGRGEGCRVNYSLNSTQFVVGWRRVFRSECPFIIVIFIKFH